MPLDLKPTLFVGGTINSNPDLVDNGYVEVGFTGKVRDTNLTANHTIDSQNGHSTNVNLSTDWNDGKDTFSLNGSKASGQDFSYGASIGATRGSMTYGLQSRKGQGETVTVEHQINEETSVSTEYNTQDKAGMLNFNHNW